MSARVSIPTQTRAAKVFSCPRTPWHAFIFAWSGAAQPGQGRDGFRQVSRVCRGLVAGLFPCVPRVYPPPATPRRSKHTLSHACARARAREVYVLSRRRGVAASIYLPEKIEIYRWASRDTARDGLVCDCRGGLKNVAACAVIGANPLETRKKGGENGQAA